jgi:hypothetical protein
MPEPAEARGSAKPRVEIPSEVTPMRSISGTRLLTVMAATTLLLLTTFMGTPQASGGKFAKCPCDFSSALLFAKKAVGKFGHRLAIQSCTKSEEGIAAPGANDFCSLIELEAENSSSEEGTRECGYEFACPAFEDGDAPLFILKSEQDNLTEAQFRACVRDIEHISKYFFRVECSPE